jgi:hypothetical protein
LIRSTLAPTWTVDHGSTRGAVVSSNGMTHCFNAWLTELLGPVTCRQ